jgi:alginate O-acetyltransferase complex protein AlgI
MQTMSLSFALLVIVGLVLFHARQSLAWRRSILLVMNLVFLASFADSWLDLLPLVAFLALAVVLIKWLNRCREFSLLVLSLTVMLFGYLYLKQYAITGIVKPLEFGYTTAGLGYIIFRVLHVAIDTYQMPDRQLDPSPWKLFRYFTSFLTFTAGPIQRYEQFLEQDEQLATGSTLAADDVRDAFGRLTDGLFRLAFMSPLMMKAHQYCIARAPFYTLAFGGAALFYMLFIFFNFSGYMGIVIGIGRLFGQKLPENFNSPFLAKNFLDFWSRWHITLSQWFKTYVFNNLLRAICSRWSRPALLPYFGVFGYFVVFFILGMWHDWLSCCVLLGFLQGLGVSVNKLWEVELRRLLGTRRHAVLTNRLTYTMLARAVTLTYFTITTIPAWQNMSYAELLRYGKSLGTSGLILNTVGCVVGFLCVEIGVRCCLRLARWLVRWHQRVPADFRLQLVLSARVFAVLLFALPDAPAVIGTQRGITQKLAIGNAEDDKILQAAKIFYGSKQ